MATDELRRVAPVWMVVGLDMTHKSVQRALLKTLSYGRFSLGGTVYTLPANFVMVAVCTGADAGHVTSPLRDYFLTRVSLGASARIECPYPSAKARSFPYTAGDLVEMRMELARVYLHPDVLAYMKALVYALRQDPCVAEGITARAVPALSMAARVSALLKDRLFVTPADIQIVIGPVLAHRISLTSWSSSDATVLDLLEDHVSAIDPPV